VLLVDTSVWIEVFKKQSPIDLEAVAAFGLDCGTYSGGGVHLPRRKRSADLGSACDAKRKAAI
jgi:hypothetical protein